MEDGELHIDRELETHGYYITGVILSVYVFGYNDLGIKSYIDCNSGILK